MRNLCIALRSLNRVTKKTFHLPLAEIAGAFPEESAAETLHPSDPEAYSGASSVEYPDDAIFEHLRGVVRQAR